MFDVCISFQLYLQTRCSHERVIRVIEELELKQKTAIEEIGFGSLLQLRCRKIDHGLCLWLINSFNPNCCASENFDANNVSSRTQR